VSSCNSLAGVKLGSDHRKLLILNGVNIGAKIAGSNSGSSGASHLQVIDSKAGSIDPKMGSSPKSPAGVKSPSLEGTDPGPLTPGSPRILKNQTPELPLAYQSSRNRIEVSRRCGVNQSRKKTAEDHRAANLECARIIAADPVKYPPDSLPGIWARTVLNPPAQRTAPAIGRPA
jgi:hypothetical protein